MDEDTVIRVVSVHAALEALDYYTLLGVSRRTGREELRDAYYRFAETMHPDNYREAADELRQQVHAIFKRAAEAYRVLGDPRLRQAYDEGLQRGEVRLRALDAAGSPRRSQLPEPSPWRERSALHRPCSPSRAGSSIDSESPNTCSLGTSRTGDRRSCWRSCSRTSLERSRATACTSRRWRSR